MSPTGSRRSAAVCGLQETVFAEFSVTFSLGLRCSMQRSPACRERRPARSHAHCRRVVLAGTGFVMWRLMLYQGQSQARMNTEGEEHESRGLLLRRRSGPQRCSLALTPTRFAGGSLLPLLPAGQKQGRRHGVTSPRPRGSGAQLHGRPACLPCTCPSRRGGCDASCGMLA